MASSASAPDLTVARDRIDRIDDRICELLREREIIVGEVARAKRNRRGDHTAFRPEREAAILRRLRERSAAKGGPPFEVVARVWREIVSSSVLQQETFSVGLPKVAGERGMELYALARDYFGGGVDVAAEGDLDMLYERVSSDRTRIGLVPSAGEFAETVHGNRNGGASIFAALPFWGGEGRQDVRAYAFGRVRLAPSGDDTTLVAARTTNPAPVVNALGTRGMKAEVCGRANGLFVFAVEGFYVHEVASLGQAVQDLCDELFALGSYARPMRACGGDS